MKRKFLSVVMAVVVAVVCLTGCSGNLNKASFINAAKKYGMKEIEENLKLGEIMRDQNESNSVYYVEKDHDRMQLFFRDFAPDAEVKECVKAVEIIGKNDNKLPCSTYVYYLTAEDSKNAKETYKGLTKGISDPGNGRSDREEGEKDGVTYTIVYMGSDNFEDTDEQFTGEIVYGIYLKDDKIIWIYSFFDSTLDNNCVEGFCKSFGLVSPYTLR